MLVCLLQSKGLEIFYWSNYLTKVCYPFTHIIHSIKTQYSSNYSMRTGDPSTHSIVTITTKEFLQKKNIFCINFCLWCLERMSFFLCLWQLSLVSFLMCRSLLLPNIKKFSFSNYLLFQIEKGQSFFFNWRHAPSWPKIYRFKVLPPCHLQSNPSNQGGRQSITMCPWQRFISRTIST